MTDPVSVCSELPRTTILFLRPNTVDERAWREIYVRNDYFLPNRFGSDDVVIDIGAHIGSFTLAALERGAGSIWSFEADSANYSLALLNLRDFSSRVHLINAAVWRSDCPSVEVYFSGYEHKKTGELVNTGGGDVLFASSGIAVPAIAFDDAIRLASEEGARRIRLIKLDCEGSEFPILLTSRRLDLVDEIVGEYHQVKAADWSSLRADSRVETLSEYRAQNLCEHLEDHGFVTRIGRCKGTLGLFMAWRHRAK
jgi:FkbM family methyltransferase